MYTTEGLVCGSYERSGSDKLLLLFTNDAGMIYARAAGVRDEKSKLRYALQDFSLTRLSLVRGKQGWRITGAEPVQDLYVTLRTREQRAAIRSTFQLLRRLVQGEEVQKDLFHIVLDGCMYLKEQHDAQTLLIGGKLLQLRMLTALGYVAAEGDFRTIVEHTSLFKVPKTMLPALHNSRALDELLDKGIVASHL